MASQGHVRLSVSVLREKGLKSVAKNHCSLLRKILQLWYWWQQMDSWGRGTRRMSVTTPIPTPPLSKEKRKKGNSLGRKPSKRTQSMWQRRWGVALQGWWLLAGVGEDSVLLKGQATGSLAMLQCDHKARGGHGRRWVGLGQLMGSPQGVHENKRYMEKN